MISGISKRTFKRRVEKLMSEENATQPKQTKSVNKPVGTGETAAIVEEENVHEGIVQCDKLLAANIFFSEEPNIFRNKHPDRRR